MRSTCIQSTLPFSKVKDLHVLLDSSLINEAVEYQNQHINMLSKHRCYTPVAHINTQSLPSFFDEFSLMMNRYQFDIVSVSESWLKDNRTQLEYIQINGYASVWKNRDSKTGGGVGFYVKEHMSFKVCHDLGKIDESIKILWVKLRGRNKNTPFLTGVGYQPSSNETEKLVWLEKFEHILSEVYTKWNGDIILAGELNIDLLNGSNESQHRYKDILHLLSLHQHITSPTKSKTLIDHVTSTIPDRVRHHILNTEEISDHDTPYVIFNIKKEKYEPRYKFIRKKKSLVMENYVTDFQQLPPNLVYSFDNPDDQVAMVKKLITDCINIRAPLKRVKLTRPIAPWMHDLKIIELQKELASQQETYRSHETSINHKNYKNTRNKL